MKNRIILLMLLTFILLSNSAVALAAQDGKELNETQMFNQLGQLEEKYGGKFILLESDEDIAFNFSSIQELEDFIASIKEEVYVESISPKNNFVYDEMNLSPLSMKQPSTLTQTHAYYVKVPGSSVHVLLGTIKDSVSVNRSINPNNYGYFLDIISHVVYTTDSGGTYIEFYKTEYVTDGGRTLYSGFNGLYQLKISFLGFPVGYNFDVSGYYEFAYSQPF